MNMIKISLTTLVFSGLMACSSSPKTTALPENADGRQEIERFSADIEGARGEQSDVLSPQYFKKAEKSLSEAKSNVDKQKENSTVLKNVAVGRANLARAQEVTGLAKQNIGDVIVARQRALSAGAHNTHGSEFKSADNDLKDLTEEFEDNDTSDAAGKRKEFQAKYLDLEVKAITLSKLGKSQNILNLARKEGAEKFAPQTLETAVKSLRDSEAYIVANPQNSDEIATRSIATEAAAEHLIKITRAAKSGKNATSEEAALALDAEQQRAALAAGTLTQALTAEQRRAQGLSAENQSLESNQALAKIFDEAQKEFSPSEAEVYKQGDALVIRLKNLAFPTAKATLKGSNFPVLAKVQKVIGDFGTSNVVVEGHTDSVGGKTKNQKLSTERAEAIKEYLVANKAVQDQNISAIGYDFQKPLATNKTAAGRAQNRRVDVRIEPVSQAR